MSEKEVVSGDTKEKIEVLWQRVGQRRWFSETRS